MWRKLLLYRWCCSAHYKNRKNFINFCHHKKDFNLNAEWHFYATSHGKGHCDGMGGTVKRIVTKASLQRTTGSHILAPTEMYSFCTSAITGIEFIYVSTQYIELSEKMLQERFDSVGRIPNTRANHCFITASLNTLRVKLWSNSTEYEEVCIIKENRHMKLSTTIKINDYVACVYDGKWLGTVKDFSDEHSDYHVHFFYPSGVLVQVSSYQIMIMLG